MAAFFFDLIQWASTFVQFHANGSRLHAASQRHFLPMPAVALRLKNWLSAEDEPGVRVLVIDDDSIFDWRRFPVAVSIDLPCLIGDLYDHERTYDR
ncbi:MAG: hypothetical protein ACJ8G3_17100 [Burkholderiaceae bacterium]